MFITPADLEPFAAIALAKAEAMIADAEAELVAKVPRVAESWPQNVEIVRAILRRAIIRWDASGDGAAVQQTIPGGFSLTTDNRIEQKTLFLPDEIATLRALYSSATSSNAWSYNMAANLAV